MIAAKKLKELIETQTDYVLLDVRTPPEYQEGHIPSAILIPLTDLPAQVEQKLPDKSQQIFVYCRSGNRSKVAVAYLMRLGYQNIQEFGGILSWPYEIVTKQQPGITPEAMPLHPVE